jgi:NAD-dependent dihydropyrimidine dehydrogenase PreA subunit
MNGLTVAKQVAVVDFGICHPKKCSGGVCLSVGACPKKVLKQEEPYEMPYINPSVCIGCGLCAQACPVNAIRMI